MDAAPSRPMAARIPAVLLTLSWAVLGTATAAVVGGGAGPAAVALAAWAIPVLVAVAAIAWPPTVADGRVGDLALMAGLAAVLVAMPMALEALGLILGDQPLPASRSAEAWWAILVGLAATGLYAAPGLLRRRATAVPAATTVPRVLAVATGVTALGMLALGAAAAVTDTRAAPAPAVVGGSPGPGASGGTEAAPAGDCWTLPSLVPAATVRIVAGSSLDGRARGQAELSAVRSGIDETWTASWDAGPAPGIERHAAYARSGSSAGLSVAVGASPVPSASLAPTTPDPFGLPGPDDLTVDGPLLGVLGGERAVADRGDRAGPSPGEGGTEPTVGPAPSGEVDVIPEDHGLDRLAGSVARHCSTLIDGPGLLDAFLPARWLVTDDAVAAGPRLDAWRGELEWWTDQQGRLVRAAAHAGGLARDAWPGRGREGRLEVEMTVEPTSR